MKKIKKEVTNLQKAGNQKTLIWTKNHPKNPQKPLFLQCENGPQQGGQTNNPSGGQTNNSLKAKRWTN